MQEKLKIGPKGKDYFVLVDDDMVEYLSQFHWWRNNSGYAIRYLGKKSDGGNRIGLMHREINNTPDGLFTDHINGDRLDNRRGNLRTATPHQNCMNVRPRNSSKSGYRGVYAQWGKWSCTTGHKGKTIPIGSFATAEQAALAYNVEAHRLRGEFAILNIVPESIMSMDEQQAFVSHWLQNRGIRSDNRSGYRGVSWCSRNQKWAAQIQKKDARRHLGYFETPEEAVEVIAKFQSA